MSRKHATVGALAIIGIACIAILGVLFIRNITRQRQSVGEALAPLAQGASDDAVIVFEDQDADYGLVASEHAMTLLTRIGWRETDDRRKNWTMLRSARAESIARSLADGHDNLTYVSSTEGEPGLSGMIEPGDSDTVRGLLEMSKVRGDGLPAVPPEREVASLAEVTGAVCALLSDAPDASDLLKAAGVNNPEIGETLERIVTGWPPETRVWRVIAAPPHTKFEPTVKIQLETDPKECTEDLNRVSRILGREPRQIGPGYLQARISLHYQNTAQQDRSLAVSFFYDDETPGWVLTKAATNPADHVMVELVDDPELLSQQMSTIEFATLPDVVIVAKSGRKP